MRRSLPPGKGGRSARELVSEAVTPVLCAAVQRAVAQTVKPLHGQRVAGLGVACGNRRHACVSHNDTGVDGASPGRLSLRLRGRTG